MRLIDLYHLIEYLSEEYERDAEEVLLLLNTLWDIIEWDKKRFHDLLSPEQMSELKDELERMRPEFSADFYDDWEQYNNFQNKENEIAKIVQDFQKGKITDRFFIFFIANKIQRTSREEVLEILRLAYQEEFFPREDFRKWLCDAFSTDYLETALCFLKAVWKILTHEAQKKRCLEWIIHEAGSLNELWWKWEVLHQKTLANRHSDFGITLENLVVLEVWLKERPQNFSEIKELFNFLNDAVDFNGRDFIPENFPSIRDFLQNPYLSYLTKIGNLLFSFGWESSPDGSEASAFEDEDSGDSDQSQERPQELDLSVESEEFAPFSKYKEEILTWKFLSKVMELSPERLKAFSAAIDLLFQARRMYWPSLHFLIESEDPPGLAKFLVVLDFPILTPENISALAGLKTEGLSPPEEGRRIRSQEEFNDYLSIQQNKITVHRERCSFIALPPPSSSELARVSIPETERVESLSDGRRFFSERFLCVGMRHSLDF